MVPEINLSEGAWSEIGGGFSEEGMVFVQYEDPGYVLQGTVLGQYLKILHLTQIWSFETSQKC